MLGLASLPEIIEPVYKQTKHSSVTVSNLKNTQKTTYFYSVVE